MKTAGLPFFVPSVRIAFRKNFFAAQNGAEKSRVGGALYKRVRKRRKAVKSGRLFAEYSCFSGRNLV